MEVKSIGVQVKYAFAESVRKWLIKHYVIDTSLEFIREEETLTIPVILASDDANSLMFLHPNKVDYKVRKFMMQYLIKYLLIYGNLFLKHLMLLAISLLWIFPMNY